MRDQIDGYHGEMACRVFFQDWKANEGWGQLTKQQGEEGSKHSLIMSLLADHSLFFHPDQLVRIENKLTAYTIKVEGLLRLFEQTIWSDSPVEEFKALIKAIEDNMIVL